MHFYIEPKTKQNKTNKTNAVWPFKKIFFLISQCYVNSQSFGVFRKILSAKESEVTKKGNRKKGKGMWVKYNGTVDKVVK